MATADARLFSYGTLRDPAVQMALFGRSLDGTPDAICGFRTRMVEITDADVIAKSGTRWHPMVEESGDPRDTIKGTAFLLSQDELTAADAYEVDYERREVSLRSGGSAWLYGPRSS